MHLLRTLRPLERKICTMFPCPTFSSVAKLSLIYGKLAKRAMGQMDRSETEDLGLAARLVYGYLPSNINLLNSAESSFVLIAGLIPQDLRPPNFVRESRF